jgi:hypothetical protein
VRERKLTEKEDLASQREVSFTLENEILLVNRLSFNTMADDAAFYLSIEEDWFSL